MLSRLVNSQISTGNLAACSLKEGKTDFLNVQENACHVTVMQTMTLMYCTRSHSHIPELSENIYFIRVLGFYDCENNKNLNVSILYAASLSSQLLGML